MKIVKDITRDEIFKKISSYDIYSFYMPWKFRINKVCLSPFKSEKHPSFIIGNKYGDLTHKAFNSGHSGDCINFVMQMFGLNYFEALNRIAEDFGLRDRSTEGSHLKTLLATLSKPEIELATPLFLQAVRKDWEDIHKDYLKKGYLEPADLNISSDTTAFAVDSWFINKKKQHLPKNEICIGYNLKNYRGDWLKIYRPLADKENKWRTNIPFQEMHGLENMIDSEIGIVAKSVKDAAFIKKFITPHVCVVQAEDISAMSEESIRFINENCKRVFTSFDNDERGVKASMEINKKTGWSWINVPRTYPCTDWFELAEHTDPQTVIDYFKSKI